MSRVRLTHRRQGADMSIPYPGNVNQPDRRDPDWEQYHTFEQQVNHELPDMRHEWKDDSRDEIGFGVPEANPPTVASVRVAANKAVRIAVLLLGEKVDDEVIEAQARDLMALGQEAMDRTLERFSTTQKLYAEDDDGDEKKDDEKKASRDLAQKMSEDKAEKVEDEKKSEDEAEEKKEDAKEATSKKSEDEDKDEEKKAEDKKDDKAEEKKEAASKKGEEKKEMPDFIKEKIEESKKDKKSADEDKDEEKKEAASKKSEDDEDEKKEATSKKSEDDKDEDDEKKASAKVAGPNEMDIELVGSADEELKDDPEADAQLASLFEDGLTAKQEEQPKAAASKKAGIKKLGGQPKVAAEEATPADISSLWDSAPDVSSIFK